MDSSVVSRSALQQLADNPTQHPYLASAIIGFFFLMLLISNGGFEALDAEFIVSFVISSDYIKPLVLVAIFFAAMKENRANGTFCGSVLGPLYTPALVAIVSLSHLSISNMIWTWIAFYAIGLLVQPDIRRCADRYKDYTLNLVNSVYSLIISAVPRKPCPHGDEPFVAVSLYNKVVAKWKRALEQVVTLTDENRELKISLEVTCSSFEQLADESEKPGGKLWGQDQMLDALCQRDNVQRELNHTRLQLRDKGEAHRLELEQKDEIHQQVLARVAQLEQQVAEKNTTIDAQHEEVSQHNRIHQLADKIDNIQAEKRDLEVVLARKEKAPVSANDKSSSSSATDSSSLSSTELTNSPNYNAFPGEYFVNMSSLDNGSFWKTVTILLVYQMWADGTIHPTDMGINPLRLEELYSMLLTGKGAEKQGGFALAEDAIVDRSEFPHPSKPLPKDGELTITNSGSSISGTISNALGLSAINSFFAMANEGLHKLVDLASPPPSPQISALAPASVVPNVTGSSMALGKRARDTSEPAFDTPSVAPGLKRLASTPGFGQPAAIPTAPPRSLAAAAPLSGSGQPVSNPSPFTQTGPSTSSWGKPSGFGQASSPSPFVQTPTPAFGQPAAVSSFGKPSVFGQPSGPAFGSPSPAPAFGQPAAAPAFGKLSRPSFAERAFGPSPAPAFTTGTAPGTFGTADSRAPAFGAPSPAPLFSVTKAPGTFGTGTGPSNASAAAGVSALTRDPTFNMFLAPKDRQVAPTAPAAPQSAVCSAEDVAHFTAMLTRRSRADDED